MYPVIYKKTATGATQQWQQEIDGSKYRTISGQVGGKLVHSAWTQCEGTNVGRANERTPEQQAVFEVEANYKSKLERDYHKEKDAISEGSHIYECMLAEDYKKRILKKVSKSQPLFKHDEVYSQPKLDGMRAPSLETGIWSRTGKPWVAVPHIWKAIAPLFIKYPGLVLDGELYNHEFKSDFNELSSVFKQTKPTAEDLAKSEKFGQYHVYDLQWQRIPNMPFSERNRILKEIVEELNSPYVHYVRTDKVKSKEHLDQLYFDVYIPEGYEGQMVRTDSPYENDRTWSLLKRKEFFDAEYELVDILPGKGNWAGKARKAILKLDPKKPVNWPESDENTFKSDITGTMEFLAKVLNEKVKYIGKPTTVRYTNLTPDGVPRFGKCKEFDRIDV